MIFKRREKRTVPNLLRSLLFPRGGFRRAGQYVLHRMRRLPDNPHRIARGIFAGTFISFTPLFGLHIFGAALVAWLVRGNILAALLASLLGNPLTFPIIAIFALKFGHLMLGMEVALDIHTVTSAFVNAWGELWYNFKTFFTPAQSHWDNLRNFFKTIFWPYCAGGVILGLIAGTIMHYVTLPFIIAYQKVRTAKFKDRMSKSRFLKAPLAAMDRRRLAKAVKKIHLSEK